MNDGDAKDCARWGAEQDKIKADAVLAAKDARIAELIGLLRRVIEWTPSLPAESGLIDEISETIKCLHCAPTQRCPDHGAVHDFGSDD